MRKALTEEKSGSLIQLFRNHFLLNIFYFQETQQRVPCLFTVSESEQQLYKTVSLSENIKLNYYITTFDRSF